MFTQDEFALRSGLGLRFVRELEQGKETVRMDKVNSFMPDDMKDKLCRLIQTRIAILK